MKKKRGISIFIFILLMISAIVVLDRSLTTNQERASLGYEPEDYVPSLPAESGVFRRSEYALDYENMPDGDSFKRSLEDYYENRAYPGAPPIIPHPLVSEQGIGGKSCLQCHENGGYVDRFKAYAPVTPHPEMLNCRQCHAAPKSGQLFKKTNWVKISHPEIKGSALQGGPPVIPHSLQMRENCLACHAGPAAPNEIKVSHPYRVNCRQCHVPVQEFATLKAKWDSTDQFFRKPN
ncbi:MAG: hypothetical protein ABJF04_22340 [Reichenbachiella sp.]